MKSNIIKLLFIIISVSALRTGYTNAYFSDTKQGVITGNVAVIKAARIVINEVYYIGDDEWLEIYNAGNSSANIKGWQICNSNQNCGSLNPAKKTALAPNEYALISHSSSDLKSWNVDKSINRINYAGGKIDFLDIGDMVLLKNTDGMVVDRMSYGINTTSLNPSCSLVIIGHSLQRQPAGKDTDTSLDFIDQSIPSPGY